MIKRANILNFIKKNIDSGKVNIIFTPKGVDSEFFLMNDLRKFLENNFDNCLISYTSAYFQEFDLKLFNSFITTNRKIFVLINDLSKYKNPLSIIEMFYGNENINVIATTSISIKRLAGKNETDVRGRFNLCFYPPFLYGDECNIDSSDSIKKLFELYFYDYKYCQLARQIYLFLLRNVGLNISYRDIYANCGSGISLVTFVDVVNYLNDCGLFYIIPRKRLDSSEPMNYGYAFYPCRSQDILSKELDANDAYRTKAYFDSMVVAKLLYDKCKIFKAFSFRRKMIGEKRVIVYSNDGILIKKGNREVFLKTIYFDKDNTNFEMPFNFKGNIQKMLAFYNEKAAHFNESGIVKCFIKQILEKGVF